MIQKNEYLIAGASCSLVVLILLYGISRVIERLCRNESVDGAIATATPPAFMVLPSIFMPPAPPPLLPTHGFVRNTGYTIDGG